MPRADDGLAFMLKYENVAWYQDGVVRILDRRVYFRHHPSNAGQRGSDLAWRFFRI